MNEIKMCDFRYDEGLRIRKELVWDTLTAFQGSHGNSLSGTTYVMIKQATKDGAVSCKVGGVADFLYPTSTTRRGRVQDNGDCCPTITAEENGICKIENEYRIRKLTPLECWRLMGYTDEDFHKAESVNSNTQLYKEAGNAIIKQVLMHIFRGIL